MRQSLEDERAFLLRLTKQIKKENTHLLQEILLIHKKQEVNNKMLKEVKDRLKQIDKVI